MTPGKRSSSPQEDIDPEKGYGTVFTPKKQDIEVVVHKTVPSSVKKSPGGEDVLKKAIGPGVYLGFAGKKSRKQKRRVHKKTQKRRSRK